MIIPLISPFSSMSGIEEAHIHHIAFCLLTLFGLSAMMSALR